MQQLGKRISYVKGLADGLNLGRESKEGRILHEILNILGDMAEDIEEVIHSQVELEDYVENIDQDLNDLEDDVYELDEEYETYDDESEYYEDDEGFLVDETGEHIEMECPNCQEEVYFDSKVLEDEDVVEVICPSCNEVIFVNDQDIIENRSYSMHHQDTEDI